MRLHSFLVALFHFVGHCLTPTDSLVTSSYDQILQWNSQYLLHSKTLNTLHKLHNSSAILFLIELTRNNFTDEDLSNCKRFSLASLNFTVESETCDQFNPEADIAIRTAHFLTNLFS